MRKTLGLGTAVILILGLSLGFSSSTVFVQSESSECNGVEVGGVYANISVNGSKVSVEGLYCANTGGYGLLEQGISQDGDEINAVFRLKSPSDNEFVTQAITPIRFEASDGYEDGQYDLNYEILLDEEVIESNSSSIQIGESESPGIMALLRDWLLGLF